MFWLDCTIGAGGIVAPQLSALLVHPGLDLHEIGHERRNLTLDHRRVAFNHILILGLGYVELWNDFGSKKIINKPWESGKYWEWNGWYTK